MFKRIPLETKNEILEKVKNCLSVTEAAKQYAVSSKTIYAWLSTKNIAPHIASQVASQVASQGLALRS